MFLFYNKISLGILIISSNELGTYFVNLGKYVGANGKTRAYKKKFGASATQMGKLLPRLKAGRN